MQSYFKHDVIYVKNHIDDPITRWHIGKIKLELDDLVAPNRIVEYLRSTKNEFLVNLSLGLIISKGTMSKKQPTNQYA